MARLLSKQDLQTHHQTQREDMPSSQVFHTRHTLGFWNGLLFLKGSGSDSFTSPDVPMVLPEEGTMQRLSLKLGVSLAGGGVRRL